MECPYCKYRWESKNITHCPVCGKFVNLSIYGINTTTITQKQLIIIIASSFSSYLVLLFLIYRIKLPFYFEFYLGLIASFIMGYEMYYFYKQSNNKHIRDYFPKYKRFFLLMSVIIWFSFLGLSLPYEYFFDIARFQTFSLVDSFINFFTGYFMGTVLTLYLFFKSGNRARAQALEQRQNE